MGNLYDKQNKKQATRHGETIYTMHSNKFPQKHAQQRIVSVEIRACRIFHGSYSWILTGLASGLTFATNDPVEHWWLVIQTDKGFYTFQKWIDCINMYRNNQKWQADQLGLCCSGRQSTAQIWTKKYLKVQDEHKTMNWLIVNLQKYNFGEYSLFNANCQDFAQRTLEIIQNHQMPKNRRYPAACLFGVIPLTGIKRKI